MSRLLFILLFTFTFSTAFSQRGYDPYVTEDGIKISTKWAKAKDEDGTKKPALLIGVQNLENKPATYSYDINLYFEGVLRETGRMAETCINGRSSKIGKLSGTYFIPQKFTEAQLKNSDFNFTIDGIEVERIERCAEETIE